jgi:hypothetical protein
MREASKLVNNLSVGGKEKYPEEKDNCCKKEKAATH